MGLPETFLYNYEILELLDDAKVTIITLDSQGLISDNPRDIVAKINEWIATINTSEQEVISGDLFVQVMNFLTNIAKYVLNITKEQIDLENETDGDLETKTDEVENGEI